MKTSNIWRLLKILMILCRRRQNVKAKEIADEIEISIRQVYRDINCLKVANIPIYSDKDGYHILEGFFMPKINFTISEALTLIFLVNSLKMQKGTPYMQCLEMAADKILHSLPKDLQKMVTGLYVDHAVDFGLHSKIDYKEIKDLFSQAYAAYMQKESIIIDYRNIDRKEVNVRKVDPYGFKFYFSVWYLIGYCHLRKSIRTFRVDRIKKIQMTGETFQVQAGFDMEDFFSGSWGIVKGKKAKVRLLFDPKIADFIAEIQWHPSQKLSRQPSGELLVEYEVMGIEEIERWILSLGPHVKVLAPLTLQKKVYQSVLAMKKNHESPFLH